MYLAKAGENEVFEKLASNAARTDEKDSRLSHDVSLGSFHVVYSPYLLDLPVQRPEGLFRIAFSKHSCMSTQA